MIYQMQAEKQQHINNVSVLPINTKNTKSKLDLIVFKQDEVAGVWVLVKDLIQKACDRAGSFADAEDVKVWLEKGTMQLWVAFDGKDKKIKCVCVTNIQYNILILILTGQLFLQEGLSVKIPGGLLIWGSSLNPFKGLHKL